MQFIDLATQYQRNKEAIDNAIHEVLDSSKYIMGPQVKELESTLAEYVGVKHCVSVSSGTDSLMIALMAMGIAPGDEVITVPFTWISSTEVISLVGATPVFVDIDLDTFNMNPSLIEKAITPKTKAILAVNLFGQMADYTAINEIANKYNLPVLEDAAQSFGSSQNGIKSCGATTVGSTSFFPAKPFGCYGDGGALFTNDSELCEKMQAIRTHGGIKRHHHTLVGMNGRLDTIQAAVLLAKWPDFDNEVKSRIAIGQRYSQLLEQVCEVPRVLEGNTHVYANYTIRTSQRSELQEKLKEKEIPSAIYYPKCLHEQPVFC